MGITNRFISSPTYTARHPFGTFPTFDDVWLLLNEARLIAAGRAARNSVKGCHSLRAFGQQLRRQVHVKSTRSLCDCGPYHILQASLVKCNILCDQLLGIVRPPIA
ncbi:uncharacterized protein LOC127087335 isoform X2 [Lathyrus oleraceus]|uniref:uncharacterized protein LOC127087335 isoform X2 n=1 Tax=Pisum sativum TaxID=3888 RepID=UPI0021CE9A78|nr:uncharacterized protein LOC127087335 isoform X2 [Pisum sativum]